MPVTNPRPTPTAAREPGANGAPELPGQYECGPVRFAGDPNASYERRLVFDHVVEPKRATTRERFEAVARALRDLLTRRWLKTDQAYDRANPKRVYYLSMEFLIGRSLANNVMNLLLDPLAKQAIKQKDLDWLGLLEQEPDAGLGNGGLGRLAACFIESLATLQIPAIGYGLRYEYGIFRQAIENGFQVEHPDHWLAQPDPWEVTGHRKRSKCLSDAPSVWKMVSFVPFLATRRICSVCRMTAPLSDMAAVRSTLCDSGERLPPSSSTLASSALAISSAPLWTG